MRLRAAPRNWVVGGIVLLVGAIGCAQDFDSLFVDGGTCTSSATCMACGGTASTGAHNCNCTTSQGQCDTECLSGTCSTTCSNPTGCSMKCAAGASCILFCPNVPLLQRATDCVLTCGDDGAVQPRTCGDHGGVACNPLPGQCD